MDSCPENGQSCSPVRILGIEGGASKTEWVYLTPDKTSNDGWRLIAEGNLPPSNLKLMKDGELRISLRSLPTDATHVGVFLAGVIDDRDKYVVTRIAQDVWPSAKIIVGSDRDTALASTFGRAGNGITIICGTGACATGRNDGRIMRAGGRGHIVGDRGSAYRIATEALRVDLDQWEEQMGKVSSFGHAILQKTALASMDQIVGWSLKASKSDLARLTPIVFTAAAEGYRALSEVLREAAEDLARYASVVAAGLNFENPPVVGLCGSVFCEQPLFVEYFKNAVAEKIPGCVVRVIRESGAIGAARLAFDDSEVHSTRRTDKMDNSKVDNAVDLASASTEQRNPRSMNMDKMSLEDMVDMFIDEENMVIKAMQGCRQKICTVIKMAAEVINAGGRMYFVGAGASGRIGMMDATEIPPTFSEPPTTVQAIIAGGVDALHSSVEAAEDDPVAGAVAVRQRGVKSGDLVVGIAASGRTPFAIGALEEARAIGAKTVFLTCNPNRVARPEPFDVEIDLETGPELLTGSTRLKAGTATKVTLNTITTCMMVLLGKVRSNLMVSVKASNSKLRDRAARLVIQLTGCTYQEACEKLANAEWSVTGVLAKTEGSKPSFPEVACKG